MCHAGGFVPGGFIFCRQRIMSNSLPTTPGAKNEHLRTLENFRTHQNPTKGRIGFSEILGDLFAPPVTVGPVGVFKTV